MNKGRNIAILMAVMLCISIQFFFMLLGRDNESGVIDGVRYIYQSGELEDDTMKYYKFYYKEGPERDVTVSYLADGRKLVEIAGSDYSYYISGESKKDFSVSYVYNGKYEGSEEEAFEIHTKRFFKAMIFGKEPVLKLYEALIVSTVLATGALVYANAEKLWYKFSKKNFEADYEPVWDDFKKYRNAGAAIMSAAGCLFLIFILF